MTTMTTKPPAAAAPAPAPAQPVHPRIFATSNCQDGSLPASRARLQPLIWEKSFRAWLECEYNALPRTMKVADALVALWPCGARHPGNGAVVGRTPAPGGASDVVTTDLLGPRELASYPGEGPGQALFSLYSSAAIVASDYPGKQLFAWVPPPPAWCADTLTTYRGWMSEFVQAKWGLMIDTGGCLMDGGPAANFARWCAGSGVPLFLEDHVDSQFAEQLAWSKALPRVSMEGRCNLVESGGFLRGAGENVCQIAYWKSDLTEGATGHFTIAEQVERACAWLRTGRWSVMLGLQDADDAMLAELGAAREEGKRAVAT